MAEPFSLAFLYILFILCVCLQNVIITKVIWICMHVLGINCDLYMCCFRLSLFMVQLCRKYTQNLATLQYKHLKPRNHAFI